MVHFFLISLAYAQLTTGERWDGKIIKNSHPPIILMTFSPKIHCSPALLGACVRGLGEYEEIGREGNKNDNEKWIFDSQYMTPKKECSQKIVCNAQSF